MITPELVSYIKAQQALGKNSMDIKASLMQSGGWRMVDIDEAFTAASAKPRTSHLKRMIAVLVVLLVVGGGAGYAVMKYHIRTVADVKALFMGTTEDVPIQETAPVSPLPVQDDRATIAEEYIVDDLAGIALSEKMRSIKGIPMTDVCTNKEYLDARALTIETVTTNGVPLSPADYYCHSTASTFVQSLPLPRGGYFCIDSQEFFGVVDTLPTTSCGPTSTTFSVDQTMLAQVKKTFAELTTPAAIAAFDAGRARAIAEAETSKRISIQATAGAVYDPRSSYVGTCADVKRQFSDVTCFDSVSSYAVSYTISSGATMCIDANGFADIITKKHTKAVCPK
jgi:hypothetical protein